MTISIVAEKAFDKNQYIIMVKLSTMSLIPSTTRNKQKLSTN
jgi:hypothetical protein